ncbi:cell wall hydrolase [Anoxybacter fermentans]|uniref:Cell wall hydrolase n=1 Tax=Anoxybacter fermentans TaxID=1323375 RepID=A0A3Q9HPA3_9FIRM|nr:cell wall hydrolase [Anoxybacter fermentans]AZR72627.1 cell wall hydrolase [Anoxybacter fermentans]
MRFFSRKRRKTIANLLIVNLILPMVLLIILSAPAFADDLTEEDAYKGLAIALALILLAKMMKKILGNDQKVDIKIDIKTSTDYTKEDLEWLARVIYAEARGEPYEGQVAVGAVVLNRVKSHQFPNTIREVIFQPGQFSSVANGQIYLTPNATAYKAARDALKGKDPTFGALYFYNPKTAKNLDWFRTLKITVKIGNHVFAR